MASVTRPAWEKLRAAKRLPYAEKFFDPAQAGQPKIIAGEIFCTLGAVIVRPAFHQKPGWRSEIFFIQDIGIPRIETIHHRHKLYSELTGRAQVLVAPINVSGRGLVPSTHANDYQTPFTHFMMKW